MILVGQPAADTRRLKRLADQVIGVTGATSGNGLAIVHEAVRRGAGVVLVARNMDELERVRKDIVAAGGR